MKLEDIEAMTVEELNSQKDELSTFAATCEPKQLAARYIKARLDAAIRDEKLSEQGVTITNLNAGIETANSEAANAQSMAVKVAMELADVRAGLTKAEKRCKGLDDVAQLAASRRKALAGVMQAVNQINTTIAPLLTEGD